jgi:hypothetical protein
LLPALKAGSSVLKDFLIALLPYVPRGDYEDFHEKAMGVVIQ